MNLLREDIGKVVKGQCAFMRNGRLRAAPQPSHEQVLESRRREPCEAIDSVGNSLETAILRIVGQALPGEARSGRLKGSKISRLLLREVIESIVVGSFLGHGLYCVQNPRICLGICTHYAGMIHRSPVRIWPISEALKFAVYNAGKWVLALTGEGHLSKRHFTMVLRMVGQIAKIMGCRAAGVAGGQAKCDFVFNELGFDACADHHKAGLAEKLKAACPKGIDVYFENAGGKVFEAVLPLMNPFGRIPVCGLIAHYNATQLPPGPDKVPLVMRSILFKRLNFRGFIVSDFVEQQPQFNKDMGKWVREGKVKYKEDIVEGLENTVSAFKRLFTGQNFGKLPVQVGPAPKKS